jgi:two-component system, LuxR family, sensor kinase FixL
VQYRGGDRGHTRRELTVLTARTSDMVEIRVADAGPGLPKRVRPHLFQPFVTSKPNGMGVGMSVCRTIVEASKVRRWRSAMTVKPRGPA